MNMRLFVVALLQKLVLKRSLSTELWMILVCIVSGTSCFVYNSQQASASQSAYGPAAYFRGMFITAVVLMPSSLSMNWSISCAARFLLSLFGEKTAYLGTRISSISPSFWSKSPSASLSHSPCTLSAPYITLSLARYKLSSFP